MVPMLLGHTPFLGLEKETDSVHFSLAIKSNTFHTATFPEGKGIKTDREQYGCKYLPTHSEPKNISTAPWVSPGGTHSG